MQRVIVTDSTSDLDFSFLEQHNVHVIPLSVTINGKSFEDQTDITSESFSQYLGDDRYDFKTSQPPIGKFIETYENIAKTGAEIISLHLSSGLSGTYQTAVQASEMVDAKITVIDSKSISFGLGYQLQRLIQWVEEGYPTEEIVSKIENLQKDIKLYVIIGQLDQLIKGGRISKAKGLIGNLMKIKPIGSLIDGKLEIIHNARTQNACIKYVIKDLKPFIGEASIKSIGISHAKAKDFMAKFKEKLDETFTIQNFDSGHTTPVISSHTGTGAIGLVVLKDSSHQ
ncbi:DegV family protein [Staphylococcus lutrae]|uniref:Fatty acid-binding protein DegV n=1 Tax=Staphylococcus lutrae TaxID=155085 RepID=A0AAC9RVB9_9STAP|nr:DegV family protein [Staphylococcus lutrae]ARJ51849.1 fatty acid-binding protein DegV [Staphylococcus lutrae]PNZ36090.1 DegV family protein [Staphylococcus lutrae]